MIGQLVGQLENKLSGIDQKIDTLHECEGPRGNKGDRGEKGNPGATWHNSFGDPNANGAPGNPSDYLLDAPTGTVQKVRQLSKMEPFR